MAEYEKESEMDVEYKILEVPEPSGWECELFGKSFVFSPAKGDVPNWFWRQTQYLVFGFVWKREAIVTKEERTER